MKHTNFVAVDFETMTPNLTSACSIGLVKVANGVIAQKFYSLIKPIPDDREERNSFIHHLTDEMVENAPTFKDLFPFILRFVGGDTIVCHNKGADLNIFRQCMAYYNLTGLNLDDYIDTLDLYGQSLDLCCKEKGILLSCHHDALADAEACAKLLLCFDGHISTDLAYYDIKDVMSEEGREKRKYVHDTLMPLDEEDVKNRDTIFFQKKVVITGTFENYPVRNELGELLKQLGADMNTSISKKTDIVIIGVGAGPSKLQKIENLKSEGYPIRLVYEEELCKILKSVDSK